MSEMDAGTAGEIVGFIWDIIDFDDQHYIKLSLGNGTDFTWQMGVAEEHHGKVRVWGKGIIPPGQSTTIYMNRSGMGVDLELTIRYKQQGDPSDNEKDEIIHAYASVPNVGENKYDLRIGDHYKDKWRLVENGWFERNKRGAASMECDIYLQVQRKNPGDPDFYKMWEHERH